jgi:hypothetical protein
LPETGLPVFEMRSLQVVALRGMTVAAPVWAVVAVACELAISDESTTNAIGIPLAFILAGLAFARATRLYLRLDPDGVHVRNYLDTQDVPWSEVREITSTNDFAFQSTVGFDLPAPGEFFGRMARAQVSADVAAIAKRRQLLEVVRQYADCHEIPLYLELGPDGRWRVPVDEHNRRVAANTKPLRQPAAGPGRSDHQGAAEAPGDPGGPPSATRGSMQPQEITPRAILGRFAWSLLFLGPIIAVALSNEDLETNDLIELAAIAAAIVLALLIYNRFKPSPH